MVTETASRPAAEVPPRPTDAILTGLAERIGAQFTASSIFGAPVERDGVTVIPVAALRFGFGGGGGAGGDASRDQSGEGGGGGGMGTPVGYIELKEGRSRFVPIVHPARMTALVAGAMLAVLLIARPRKTHR